MLAQINLLFLKNGTHIIICGLLVLWVALAAGCKDDIDLNFDANVSLSADTLRFDTVFCGVRSATATLMVRNHSKSRIRIDRAHLDGGANSSFRFNIDGVANGDNDVSGIEIGGKDSVYVFVDVQVKEGEEHKPFIVRDKLHIIVNGNDRSVVLETYGQNAVRLDNRTVVSDSTLTGELPFLVTGTLLVDSTCTLTIDPGARLYFHDRAQMVVFGRLVARGTLEKPIQMLGDRLDYLFSDVHYSMTSGQWQGVYLNHGKGTHELDYVEITGATHGLYATSWSRNDVQRLVLRNCRIHNHADIGLAAINTDVEAVNCEISNAANYCAYLAGGTHTFIHCTIANYYGNTNVNIHQTHRGNVPAVCVNDIPKTAQMSSKFLNCIISGTQQSEYDLLSYFEDTYPIVVSNSYLKCDSTEIEDDARYIANAYWHWGDELFRNDYYRLGEYDDYDFRLNQESRARDIGSLEVGSEYPTDRNGQSRTADGKPDAGCYEYSEQDDDD